MADEHLEKFVLVGGTALSLQVGHRISVDIDLFSDEAFDAPILASHLSSHYKTENLKILKNGIFCFINDIKIDIISHQYPWVQPAVTAEGVRMVSLKDLSAMKLNAIVQNGSRLKDFVDLYVLLNYLSLQDMYASYEKKYPDTNRAVVQNAVLYHADIKPARIDYVGVDLSFEEIKARLTEAVLSPSSVFFKRDDK